MHSSAIVLYAAQKKDKSIILFDQQYGKIDVIVRNITTHLFHGALIDCRVKSAGSKKYLQESFLQLMSLPKDYSDLLFVHSLLGLVRHTHGYDNACRASFETLQASLLAQKDSISPSKKIYIITKLLLLGSMADDKHILAKNNVDYLIYTPTKDILKEATSNIDCAELAQWIWSCLATHPHKDKLYVVFQQMLYFKEYFLL